jgi:hypothetical protein
MRSRLRQVNNLISVQIPDFAEVVGDLGVYESFRIAIAMNCIESIPIYGLNIVGT